MSIEKEQVKLSEIAVLVREEHGIGYGYINDNGEITACAYQNRISLWLESLEEIEEDLALGKLFITDVESELDGVNEILYFWLIERIHSLDCLRTFDSFMEALEEFKSGLEPFMVFKYKEN